MAHMNTDEQKKSFLPWHLSWITVVLGVITVCTFLAIPNASWRRIVPVMYGGGMFINSVGIGAQSVPSAPKMAPTATMDSRGYYPPNYGSEVPITDTREFTKVNYNASMQTRDVQGLTQRVSTTVRGHGGRVDAESSAEKYGYITFSLPESQYEAFRSEVESLVGSKFLSVNVSSQNLLPQKVSIEDQQKQASTTLAEYQTTRQKLTSDHASNVRSIQASITAYTNQLASLRAASSTPEIIAQIQAVSANLSSVQQQLTNENLNYTNQLSSIDSSIKSVQDWQKSINTQDQKLLDTVATVTGTISINWISLWGIALLYLPGYWIPGIFAVLTVLSYLNDRRRARNLGLA